MLVEVGNFIYTKGEKGDWIYKSKVQNNILRTKGSKLKVNNSHKDPVNYKVLQENEQQMIEDYQSTLKNIVLESTKYLLSITKDGTNS